MMAIRWLEARAKENNRQETTTKEQLERDDCLSDSYLFEIMRKVVNNPMEARKIWPEDD